MKIKYFPIVLAVTFFALQLIAYLTQTPLVIPTAIVAGLIFYSFALVLLQ
jgi:hypothetical protein